jgi:hypothetical protein
MLMGYARVSTADHQDTAVQVEALKQAGTVSLTNSLTASRLSQDLTGSP